MSDFDANAELSAYLDGELSGAQLAQMEQALAADPDLQAELDELRAVIEGLGALPQHKAPAGLMAGVMAGVSGLSIPVAEGAFDAAAESTELAAAVPVPSNVVHLAWFKTPAIATALAASLVVGVVWFSGQNEAPSSAPAPSAFEAAVAEAPVPSGAVVGDELDAVADLGVAEGEEQARERLAGRLASEEDRPELLEAAEPDVIHGAAGAAAPPAVAVARPAATPARRADAPDSAVGPDGVYEAEWESDGELAAADDAMPMAEPADPEVGFAPEPPASFGEDMDGSVDDVTMDDEPLEDFSDPPGDAELLEVASSAAPTAGAGSMRRSSDSGAARSSSSSRSRGPVKLDEVTFTAVGQATVMVTDQAKADELLGALRARGWSVASSPSGDGRIAVTVITPETQRDEMLRILRAHGSLRISGAGEPADGYQRIDLTVSF